MKDYMRLAYFILFNIVFLNTTIYTSDLQTTALPPIINSEFDEYPCTIYKDQIIFIRKKVEQFIPFSFHTSNFNQVYEFKIPGDYQRFKGSFLSIFEIDSNSYILFSGKEKNKQDFDIFLIVKKLNNKTQILKKLNISTPFFESYPQFLKNGANILYAQEIADSVPNVDIFLASVENGEILSSKPVSVVNTKENEITPYMDDRGNLYFARWDTNNYNLYKAEKINDTLWSEPRLLPPPINSEFNEISPVIHGNNIFFASDREKNGFDIFFANLCLPVLLQINFKESIKLFSNFDKIVILDENQNVIEQQYLGVESNLLYNLEPNKPYTIKIFNECTNESFFSTSFTTLCNDTSYTKYIVKYEVSNNLIKEKNIPFFLTGYYKPITKRNLNQLRKLFDYNLVGLDDSTSYIEYPTQQYYDYSEQVQKALDEIVNHIGYFAHLFEKDCISKDKAFVIEVIGYADPRQFSQNARFFEETVNDEEFGVYFTRGMQMTNDHLGKLRAYYTAKELNDLMIDKFGIDFVKNNIKWEIHAGGVINDNEDYLLLRKVNVKIKFEE
ncbi:MAG: hypothetical protein ACK42Z_08930 [Candidatus Kapaibacteriota bacterium]